MDSMLRVLIYFLALTIERRTEDYTYLRYSDGVRCKWDERMTVYVTVEQTYMKQVTGLCGTYTDIQDGEYSVFFDVKRFIRIDHSRGLDDLQVPSGELVKSVTNFANEWRTDSGVSE
jgi:hypothetical protein